MDAAVPDGNGGAYVFWEDARSGNYDVYGQHIRANGTPDPAWPAGGRAICAVAGDQTGISALRTSSGHIWVVWNDRRDAVAKNYATLMTPTGVAEVGFPLSGIVIDASIPSAQSVPVATLDETDNLLVVYEYAFTPTDRDVYGALVLINGTVPWKGALAGSGVNETSPTITTTGDGLFTAVWVLGSGTVQVQRFSVFTGAPVGSSQAVSLTGTFAVQPRIAKDGWGGALLVWGESVGATTEPYWARFYNGVLTPHGTLATTGQLSLVMGDMIETGPH
ncbi:MAG: hypothetical protein ABL977_14000, partial [Candidatus Eisenbacteria bacterium]